MKKHLVMILALMLVVTTSFAADFAPTMMKLSAEPIINYDFDGSELSIPLQISGTNAGVFFSVYTKDMAENIPLTVNGFLGWHFVNHVDTCIYYSSQIDCVSGANTISWDGKDQDGAVVPPGEYTYYLWAFDHLGAKQKMSEFLAVGWLWERGAEICGVDEQGLPNSNPFYYEKARRWVIGGDPFDEAHIETTAIPVAAGFDINYGDAAVQPTDFNYFYLNVRNVGASVAGVARYKWVPDGEAEIQTDFGTDGHSDYYAYRGGLSPGVNTDGTYLYAVDENYITDNDPNSDFLIYDYEGSMITEFDMSPWFSSLEDYQAGGQMNGGPNVFSQREGYVFLTSNGSCLVQMVDPVKYLDTGDSDDFYVWSNDNGDYTLDRNYEETAERPWVCNDYDAGIFKESAAEDDNLFFIANAYGGGAVSCGLIGPDGTGFGYFAFAGETAGWKMGSMFLDNDTPYDGIYTDNRQAGGDVWSEEGWNANEYTSGIYFIGHDSITGVITSAVDVDEEAPAAFSVAQNSPNPFNPTTTISFNLIEAATVSVEVYNVAGQKVDTITNGFLDAGSHSVVWDASGFSAGVYFYAVKSGDLTETKKMTLVK